MQDASQVLNAVASLCINPLQGKLLDVLEEVFMSELSKPDHNCFIPLQSLALCMNSYAVLRLHIKPQLAGAFATSFHRRLIHMQQPADPKHISDMVWSLALLGYAVPPHMLEDFKQSVLQTKQQIRAERYGVIGWALAVLGCLDSQFLKKMISCFQQEKVVSVRHHATLSDPRCMLYHSRDARCVICHQSWVIQWYNSKLNIEICWQVHMHASVCMMASGNAHACRH